MLTWAFTQLSICSHHRRIGGVVAANLHTGQLGAINHEHPLYRDPDAPIGRSETKNARNWVVCDRQATSEAQKPNPTCFQSRDRIVVTSHSAQRVTTLGCANTRVELTIDTGDIVILIDLQ